MCIFCEIVKGNIPCKKVYEDEKVLAFLDLSQVSKGHTLVIPKQHFDNIYDVDEKTLQHLIAITKQLSIRLTDKLNAKGCNILNNNNEAAGQTVKHLHFHIIPRYGNESHIKLDFINEQKFDLDDVLAEIQK